MLSSKLFEFLYESLPLRKKVCLKFFCKLHLDQIQEGNPFVQGVPASVTNALLDLLREKKSVRRAKTPFVDARAVSNFIRAPMSVEAT